ncbi:hypothetical protein [Streptomyces sp. NPDC102360]|uniref:hypothetical protein n=1 Tax=Streptomyces sp. NPDC102360 TaxID=3366160 RepID=UPI003808F058
MKRSAHGSLLWPYGALAGQVLGFTGVAMSHTGQARVFWSVLGACLVMNLAWSIRCDRREPARQHQMELERLHRRLRREERRRR